MFAGCPGVRRGIRQGVVGCGWISGGRVSRVGCADTLGHWTPPAWVNNIKTASRHNKICIVSRNQGKQKFDTQSARDEFYDHVCIVESSLSKSKTIQT